MQIERDVEPYSIPSDWLIGAKTNAMGRFSPAVEQIYLPPDQLSGGKMIVRYESETARSVSETRPGVRYLPRYALQRLTQKEVVLRARHVGIELRRFSPANWSHAVNHHLLQALLARKYMEERLDVEQVHVILPGEIPRYIVKLYELCGFAPLVTDLPVRGLVAHCHEEPYSAHRAIMVQLIEELVHQTPLSSRLFSGEPLPKKVFLSRKDSRRLKNEAEVESFLGKRGYVKIYPETLRIDEQFSLLARASHVVGVHGAGLGPLAYRTGQERCEFIEILSPGHMTNFYRFIAHQVSAAWVGVRGRLWPDLVAHAHDFSAPFKLHSLADFTVDLVSLDAALEIAQSSPSDRSSPSPVLAI